MTPNLETSVTVRAAKILQAIREKPGQYTIKMLAEQLQEDYQKTQKPIKQLMEAGFISWSGDTLILKNHAKQTLIELAPAMERLYMPHKGPNHLPPPAFSERGYNLHGEPPHPVASRHQEPQSDPPTHGFEVLVQGQTTGLFTWPYQPYYKHEDEVHLYVPCLRGPHHPKETLIVKAWELSVVLRPLPWI